jgi:hypothetical protein
MQNVMMLQPNEFQPRQKPFTLFGWNGEQNLIVNVIPVAISLGWGAVLTTERWLRVSARSCGIYAKNGTVSLRHKRSPEGRSFKTIDFTRDRRPKGTAEGCVKDPFTLAPLQSSAHCLFSA